MSWKRSSENVDARLVAPDDGACLPGLPPDGCGHGPRAEDVRVSERHPRAMLAECLALLDEMRDVARSRFALRAAFILAAVNDYEVAIRTLAELRDRSSEDLDCECPACRTPITRFRLNPDSTQCEGHWIIHCQECAKPFMVAHEKLDLSQGFGTWVI